MHAYLTSVKFALVMVLFGGLYGCSRESPQPQASDNQPEFTQSELSESSKIEAAQDWFIESSQLKAIGIDWDKAQIMGSWVVVPLADVADPFPKHGKYGYRYLVVQVKTNAQCAGRIVELVLDGPKLSVFQSAKTALDAVQPIIMGKAAGPLHNLSGWVILYSPAYEYEFGYVYKDGTLLPKRVQLNADQVKKVSKDEHSNDQLLREGPPRANLLQYITVTTCGYVVGGGTLFCSTDTYSIETGSGGSGGAGGTGGGGTGGGGGSGGSNWGGVGGTATPVAEDGALDVGDHSKWMTYKYDEITDIKVGIEWTESTHKIEKITTTTVGNTAATTFLPLGEGTATYLPGKLANGNDLIRFTTYFQFQAGTTATGPVANGPVFKVSGGLNAQTGEYTISMTKVP